MRKQQDPPKTLSMPSCSRQQCNHPKRFHTKDGCSQCGCADYVGSRVVRGDVGSMDKLG